MFPALLHEMGPHRLTKENTKLNRQNGLSLT